MNKIGIRVNKDNPSAEFQRIERLLAGIPNGAEKAFMRAFNRALQQGRTQGVRKVTEVYTIKAKDARNSMKMSRATTSNLEAAILIQGSKLPLKYFAHKPTKDTTGAARRQVNVAVKKDGLKPLGQAFIWRGNVFQRLGQSRLPIGKPLGPSIPSMFDNDGVAQSVLETMQESVIKRLDHEAARLLEGNK